MAQARRSTCLGAEELAAYLRGRLGSAEVRELEAHIAACGGCRELLSTLARLGGTGASVEGPGDADSISETRPHLGGEALELAAGARIGRHVVLSRLGAGGMGVVYAAHDPELDRKVAIKLLHGGAGPGGEESLGERLREEAKAMAQLAHPHVVTVFDVGRFGERIFIAMELVEGQTLARWLGESRPWREVVAAFVAAGQGLAAAHTAGLVHRDFKPENVLVGADGRIRVGDFGLARALGRVEATDPPSAATRRTRTSLAGTPFYMAPEQYRGERADARSDQFSFCVALHVALTRQHPFAGVGLGGLAAAVSRGQLRPLSDALPRWLRRVLQRGLAVAPADRYPSMTALLAELQAGLSRRPRRLVGAAAALVALGLLGLLAGRLWLAPEAAPVCQAGGVWTGVWDAERARALEARFLTTGKPYAARAFAEVSRQLGAYTAGWTGLYVAACSARGAQPEALLERRMVCLDTRRRELAALVDRLLAADARLVAGAAQAVGQLGELAGCADLEALSSQVRLPMGAGARARVAALAAELAEVTAARLAGGDGRGRERAAALVGQARVTGYRPLEAQALFELGWLADHGGDYPLAAKSFEEAVWAAEAGGHDELAALAWGMLMMTTGQRLRRLDDALAMRPRITALLERLGRRPELEATLHVNSAALLFAADRFAEAEREAKASLALYEQHFGRDDARVAEPLIRLGDVARLRHPGEARALYERGLAVAQQVHGADHPVVAHYLDRIAGTYWMEDRHAEAVATMQQVIATYQRALGPDHPDVALASNNLALIYQSMRRPEEALAASERALAIGARAFGTAHPDYAGFLFARGDALEQLGRHAEALADMEASLAIHAKALGPEHSRLADPLVTIAQIHYFQGHHAEARAHAARALAIREKVHGAQSTQLREPLLFMAWCDLALGEPARALAGLERAITMGEGASPCFFSNIEFALARALLLNRGDRQRAVGLARQARAHMEDGCDMRKERREVDAWLARHR